MFLLEMAARLGRALVELEHGDPDGDRTVEVLSYEEAGRDDEAGIVVTYADGSRFMITVDWAAPDGPEP